jgi:hypothetical protein
MKIRGHFLFAVIGIALAFGAALAACGSSSSNPGTFSGLGQSCTKTSDCSGVLVCLSNACFMPTVTPDAGTNGDAGDAAAAQTGPHLGAIGEACQTSKDCSSGLDCIVSAAGSVCDLVSYGLVATGKTCSGECSTLADCCEVPVGLGSLYYQSDAGAGYVLLPIHGCQDLLTVLGGDATVCNTLDGGPGATFYTSYTKQACFDYQAYCTCAANTWACTNSHCQYMAPCSQNSSTGSLGGCPTYTRSGESGGTCNLMTSSCQPASCAPGSDCDGKAVADTPGATCAGGDCTCAQAGCYLKCAKDLDCRAGYTCDTTTSLCAQAKCTTNSNCVTQTGDVRAQCSAGACKIPCTTDHDCGASGDIPGTAFSQQVCGTGNFCQPLGCTSDSDCVSSEVHVFCATPSPATDQSAITN